MIKGFKMKLYEGMAEEYEKRHNALWPEMKNMIHEYGGKNYTIFLDKETNILSGYIELENEEKWAKSADRLDYFVECFHKFMEFVKENNLPLDFFSWHSYSDAEKNIIYENMLMNSLQNTAIHIQRAS